MNSKLTINPLVENKFNDYIMNFHYVSVTPIATPKTAKSHNNNNIGILDNIVLHNGTIDLKYANINENRFAAPKCTVKTFEYEIDNVRNNEIAIATLENELLKKNRDNGLFLMNLMIVLAIITTLFFVV